MREHFLGIIDKLTGEHNFILMTPEFLSCFFLLLVFGFIDIHLILKSNNSPALEDMGREERSFLFDLTFISTPLITFVILMFFSMIPEFLMENTSSSEVFRWFFFLILIYRIALTAFMFRNHFCLLLKD